MAFIAIHDADGVHEQELSGDRLVIGRADNCDLVVHDKRCSKQHCRLERVSGKWRVIDMASANGTYVNGSVVSQVVLESGSEIEVGDVRIVFMAQRAKADEPAREIVAPEERLAAAKKKNRASLVGVALIVVAALSFVVFSNPTTSQVDDSSSVVEQENDRDENEQLPLASGQTEEAAALAKIKNESLLARQRALTIEAPTILVGELRDRANALVDDATDTVVHRAIALWRDDVLVAYQKRYDDLCQEIENRANALTQSPAMKPAPILADLDELLLELRANQLSKLERRVRKSKLKILKSARGLWTRKHRAAEDAIGKGDFDTAKKQLADAARDLAGTNFEVQAKSEFHLIALRQDLAKKRLTATPNASVGNTASSSAPDLRDTLSRGGSTLVAKITQAEKLAAIRKWGEAAQVYDEILSMNSDSNSQVRWQWRKDLLFGLSRLKAGVIVGVNAEDRRVKTVRIGRLTARPFAADLEIVQLKFGRVGEVTWKWRDIPQGRLLDLLRFGVNGPKSQLQYARAAIEFGNEERAMSLLLKAATKKKLKSEADAIYAGWRGVDLPPGGFIVKADTFFTPEQYADYESVLIARKLAKKVESGRVNQLVELVNQLKAQGHQGYEPLQAALKKRYERRFEDTEQLILIQRPQKARQTILAELDRRRKTAFALIFDTKKYPYPYGANKDEVQGEVDDLVRAVRVIYEEPSSLLIETNKGLKSLYDELVLIKSFMDSAYSELPDTTDVLKAVDQALDMYSYGRSDSDRKYNLDVIKFNNEMKTSSTDFERACHRLTNEYRMLMGLRAVKIEETLVLAARGHSQEMKDLGYFAHQSPTKGHESPGQRARLAGWGGSCSENIARGQRTASQAVHGWISSSGHHRNILGRSWTHLGCGKSKDGFFWTQNFATGASTKLSKEKKVKKTKKTKKNQ